MPVKASISQLLRCSLKDQFFISQISGKSNELVKAIFGSEVSDKLVFNVNLAANFLYYACTTLSGAQTIGEEFVNILQVDEKTITIKSFKDRLLALVVQTLISYISHELYKESNVFQNFLTNIHPHIADYAKYMVEYCNDLHLAFFYLMGRYHEPAKRITNTKYVQTRQLSEDHSFYTWLGILKLFQCFTCFILNIKYQQRLKISMKQVDDETVYFKRNKLCILCCDLISNQTLSPCGHSFCWFCIHQSLAYKKECPLCKQDLFPSMCIPLRN